jgi:1-acyl-sn-glycerol-3-phosphate acyltransferase
MTSTRRRSSVFRTLIGWGLGVPITLLTAITAIAGSMITRNGDIVHRCSRLWGRVLLSLCGVNVVVKGDRNLTENTGPFLIIANHQSMFDIFALSGFLPVRFAWIAKNSLFRIPLVGSAMLRAGYIPINRRNSESAHQSINRASQSLHDYSVVIFPEGTRSRSGQVGRFKRGASYLAFASGVPIIPVTITGSWQRLPPERRIVSPGTLTLQIDPPIETAGKTRAEIDESLSDVRDIMSQRVAEQANMA